jgi:hypothetical protein
MGGRMRTSQWVVVGFGLALGITACGKDRGSGDDGDGGGGVDAELPIDARPPPPIPADCLEAANRGLAWLVTQQNADGSWGSAFKVATTGFAVLKLETYAAEIGMSPFDPNFVYVNEVATGLDFLFTQASLQPITAQTHGNPDSNGNGMGVQFSTLMYENAITLMAVVAGSEPNRVIATPGSAVAGRTFRQLAEEEVDYLAYAQGDAPTSSPSSCTRGGWRYSPFNNNNAVGDNSVTQWVTLALEYARHPMYNFAIPIPDWVSVELRDWVTCIQNADGGSGYTNPSQIVNAYKTGALVQQAAFLGDTPNSLNVIAANAFLSNNWMDTTGIGWKQAPVSNYLAMYSIMKGMESMAITDLNGINWYREFCDQLKAEQNPDGSWPSSTYEREPVGAAGINSTEWALLVLERAAPPPEVIP